MRGLTVRTCSMSTYTRRDALRRIGAASAIGTVALAGCAQESGDGDDSEGGDTTGNGDGESGDGNGDPIQFGTLFPITGPSAVFGGGHQRAANLAVEEINEAGGLLGREVEVTNRDTENAPERAAQKFQTMIDQQGIVGLVGPYSSGIGTTLAPVARDNRVMQMSNGNTSPALADAGINPDDGNKYYGRTAPNDQQQGRVMARIMNETLEADTAAFLHINNPYGAGLAEVASEAFEGETLDIVGYSQQTTDYTSTLDRLFADDPDAIAAVMYPDQGRTILTQWDQGGYGGQWVGAEAIFDPGLLSDLSDITEGMYITSPQTPGDETFQGNMGGQEEITQFSAHAYDGFYLEALAVERAGEASGPAIAENIRAVSRPEGEEIGVSEFAAGRDALEAGDEIDYNGASGNVDLNENLEPIVPYVILEVQNGEAQEVEEVPISFFE